MVKDKFKDYELTNGMILEFKSLGHALDYCHKHSLNIVRAM